MADERDTREPTGMGAWPPSQKYGDSPRVPVVGPETASPDARTLTQTVRNAIRSAMIGRRGQQLAEEALNELAALAARVPELETARDNWHHEYIEACKSLKNRVMQGAAAVHRAEEAERRVTELETALAEAQEETKTVIREGGLVVTRVRERAEEAERQTAQLREALERIADNAEDWHGPPPDMGHVRALAVIAKWARAALAVGEHEQGAPEPCPNCDGRGRYTTWPHTACPVCEGSGASSGGPDG